jgi:large subunit ribosomal protein LP2
MKHLAAYLLLALNGGTPSQADVKKVLSSVGIDADDERLSKLFAELKDKDINEVSALKQGIAHVLVDSRRIK